MLQTFKPSGSIRLTGGMLLHLEDQARIDRQIGWLAASQEQNSETCDQAQIWWHGKCSPQQHKPITKGWVTTSISNRISIYLIFATKQSTLY